MVTIKLPCHGIVVTVDGGYGSIESTLPKTNAYNGIEALIMACACNGIDITTSAFIASIEEAVGAAAAAAAYEED